MTKLETVTKFGLYMDDTSELSTDESSDLYDKVYSKVCADRPWEFTKTAFSGTTSTTVPYIALPSNFAYLVQNYNTPDISTEASRPIVFVGTTYDPYQVVSFSDRRQYRDQDGYCYIDVVNGRLYFTKQPASAVSVEFDYCAIPTALANGDSPAFPARFHDIIYHGMCIDSFIIQQSDKAKSYAPEHKTAYKDYLSDMAYWNSQLIQM
jgi:hypothetical protein